MGGPGSGDWFRFDKKSTVEESLVVAVRDFRGRMQHGATGWFSWTRGDGRKSSVGYFVSGGDEPRTVTVHYRWGDREDVRIPLRLQTTPMHFGNVRWWFTCPLIVGGVACNRRVAKVYLPPGAKYFGCRKCHGLTYRSCQEAHCNDALFERIAAATGFDAKTCRKAVSKMGPTD
jgi:hypothetical protein